MSLTESLDPRFNRLILGNAQIEVLAENCRWLEGPVWFADHGLLLFSDIPNNRVMRWCAGQVSVFQSPSDFANGHARDREGRLLSCLHHGRAVTRRELDGRVTVLADRLAGKRLNSPNDVTVQPGNGAIWFTDPIYGITTDYEGGKQESERPPALYRLGPDGRLSVAADDFIGPNGLAFSPDERRLYVTETGDQFDPATERHIRVFDVEENGHLRHGRVFARISPGYADGIACDEAGNLWCSAGDGVHCLSPEGETLGKIHTGGTVANLAFGGRHRSRLFLCAGTRLLALHTNTRGAHEPFANRP
ncbi:SMP-30/gluconolactonase/LRE family protein [Acidocella sp.]|uniref:SMP-30/gluconolactonase/LRE family protein n=1 Tax=Acidocella sp. TaxID=50710 RepID=UPI002607E06D|nr:SMP-30/gluconolactonase/LRE family protein [Acidocella sp.]